VITSRQDLLAELQEKLNLEFLLKQEGVIEVRFIQFLGHYSDDLWQKENQK